MKDSISSLICWADFGLTSDDVSKLDHDTIVVTKWNWDYSVSHRFQKKALDLVQENPRLKILICCNHPEVLTNGRGLQKPKKGETFHLIEFDSEQVKNSKYPLHQIERGGGLTFHHPGQFIFYPLVRLNPKTLSLSIMINQIFDVTSQVLKGWGIKNLNHENQLLGLWHEGKKVASMGIAINKLTTFHGMALNILNNHEMMHSLQSLNPCGLNIKTYTSVESLTALPDDPIESFKTEFLKRIHHEWK
jgi:lipoyl(octanoyl) transferase